MNWSFCKLWGVSGNNHLKSVITSLNWITRARARIGYRKGFENPSKFLRFPIIPGLPILWVAANRMDGDSASSISLMITIDNDSRIEIDSSLSALYVVRTFNKLIEIAANLCCLWGKKSTSSPQSIHISSREVFSYWEHGFYGLHKW